MWLIPANTSAPRGTSPNNISFIPAASPFCVLFHIGRSWRAERRSLGALWSMSSATDWLVLVFALLAASGGRVFDTRSLNRRIRPVRELVGWSNTAARHESSAVLILLPSFQMRTTLRSDGLSRGVYGVWRWVRVWEEDVDAVKGMRWGRGVGSEVIVHYEGWAKVNGPGLALPRRAHGLVFQYC